MTCSVRRSRRSPSKVASALSRARSRVDFSPSRLPDERYIRTAAAEYGWAARRVERAIRELSQLAFKFSVDVVPAVVWDDHYGIPEVGLDPVTGRRYLTGGWRRTDPVALTRRTQLRNRAPQVGGVGAYVRIVKSVKQVKAHHLPDAKPSALFYEFILYEGFVGGAITGASWADMTASALAYLSDRLNTLTSHPVRDAVLGRRTSLHRRRKW